MNFRSGTVSHSSTPLERAQTCWSMAGRSAGIENWSTGNPVVLGSFDNGTTAETIFTLAQRPAWNGKSSSKGTAPYTKFDWQDFAKPAPYTIGNAPRALSWVHNPDSQNFDFSLTKNTRFGDRYNVQIRMEMFNAFNHPNLGYGRLQFRRPDLRFERQSDRRQLWYGSDRFVQQQFPADPVGCQILLLSNYAARAIASGSCSFARSVSTSPRLGELLHKLSRLIFMGRLEFGPSKEKSMDEIADLLKI